MVTQDPSGARYIRYGDGRGTAGTATYYEDRSYAHTALLLHPAPRRILNICFGVGNSLSSVTQYDVEHVDAVELSPGVALAAPFFASTNRNVLRDPYLYSWVINGSVEPRPPDMDLLLRRLAEPRVRSDLASIRIDDPIDFLAYFVMADAEVAAFAGDAPVVTDDRTRLDFTVPRSVESFFGISNSITDDWLVNLMDRKESLIEKSARMCVHKRSVLPHLTNADSLGLAPETLAARLDARLASLPHGCGSRGAERPAGASGG
jgi:hypothetical protein